MNMSVGFLKSSYEAGLQVTLTEKCGQSLRLLNIAIFMKNNLIFK
jgi:hypothetical protein